MSKLMRWRRTESTENTSGLVLELSEDGVNWYHYTNPLFSKYRVPELNMEGASKGYSTATNCLRLGFKYISSEND